jgi:hypothetical protein
LKGRCSTGRCKSSKWNSVWSFRAGGHSREVAVRAEELAIVVGELPAAASLLHGVGYAPRLAVPARHEPGARRRRPTTGGGAPTRQEEPPGSNRRPPLDKFPRGGRLTCGDGALTWAVRTTDEYAAWFRTLIKGRPGLRIAGSPGGRRLTRGRTDAGTSPGRPAHGRRPASPQGTAAGFQRPVRDPDHLRLRPRLARLSSFSAALLGGDKAGNWERWYRDNIPIAEQLYLDYTHDTEE